MSTLYNTVQVDETPSNVLPAGKAATALIAGNLVYLSSAGVWTKAAATAISTVLASRTDAVGVVWKDVQQYEMICPVRKIHMRGFSSLTIGQPVFLVAAGLCSQTSLGEAYHQQIVGLAVSASEIMFDIQNMDITEGAGSTLTGADITLSKAAASATAVTNFATIENTKNASSMTGTGARQLWKQYYYDATTPATVSAGAIDVVTEGNWTSTGSSQDATMDFYTALNGSLVKQLSIPSTGIIAPTGGILMADATNIALNTTTGTLIGTAVEQKLGFWAKTPVVQPASANDAIVTTSITTTATTTNIKTTVAAIIVLLNQIRLDLVNTGLIKGAA